MSASAFLLLSNINLFGLGIFGFFSGFFSTVLNSKKLPRNIELKIRSLYSLKWNTFVFISDKETFQTQSVWPFNIILLPTSFVNCPDSEDNRHRFWHEFGHTFRMDYAVAMSGFLIAETGLIFSVFMIIFKDWKIIPLNINLVVDLVNFIFPIFIMLYLRNANRRKEYFADWYAMLKSNFSYLSFMNRRKKYSTHIKWKNGFQKFKSTVMHPSWEDRIYLQTEGFKDQGFKYFLNSIYVAAVGFIYPVINGFALVNYFKAPFIWTLTSIYLMFAFVLFYTAAGDWIRQSLLHRNLSIFERTMIVLGTITGAILAQSTLLSSTKFITYPVDVIEIIASRKLSEIILVNLAWVALALITIFATSKIKIKFPLAAIQFGALGVFTTYVWSDASNDIGINGLYHKIIATLIFGAGTYMTFLFIDKALERLIYFLSGSKR